MYTAIGIWCVLVCPLLNMNNLGAKPRLNTPKTKNGPVARFLF